MCVVMYSICICYLSLSWFLCVFRRSSRLRIRKARLDDSGVYSCRLRSVLGEANSDTLVTITQGKSISHNIMTVHITMDNITTVHITIDNITTVVTTKVKVKVRGAIS